ncbi:M20 metallopeptidase family protein [Enterococcus camelliae]|uniref:M20 family metallopeptidase n=1 Tax=Enterococcus camelliae TaxID=453959 RepID=A0ABW5TKK1_9ENTE
MSLAEDTVASQFLEKAVAILQENNEYTIANRRHLHAFPELSFQEEQTRAFIQEKLLSYGYTDIQTEVGGGGILATLDTGKPGPTIALRADFDALPIHEETELPFKSKNDGVMHACGHDVHTATLLSVAQAVSELDSYLTGKLIFIFQHAEELPPGGAIAIMESGALDEVDAIFGLHIQGGTVDAGKVYVHPGYMMAAADSFEIQIQGKGGHGSAPNTTVDATVVAAYLIQELQTIVSRRKDPIKSGVLSVTAFHAGEGADNIIADKAFLKGTVRTFEKEVQEQFKAGIVEITEHITAAHGATATVSYKCGYPSVYNYPEETNLVEKLFIEQFGKENVVTIQPTMGGEDFAYYLQKIPGTFFNVPAGIAEQEVNYPHHHPKFTADEASLLIGAKAFLSIIQHYLVKE